jgi:beta-glucosidase-like glycosyl hydrolase
MRNRRFLVAEVHLTNEGADDRTLHELYLWPFAEGVRAGTGAVMTAYNAVSKTRKLSASLEGRLHQTNNSCH